MVGANWLEKVLAGVNIQTSLYYPLVPQPGSSKLR